ncbi:hypothetical protein DUI87_28701 [Hirundo rustica rustica]|uniref:Envelope glycoprotein n=1 Tax=Hirundo rustica rustica TaxID=333673 RepID=A0A3M0J224_HIRRU|nr:hypothetical protein DUI87_28701 [Hirundo rustica rustica]
MGRAPASDPNNLYGSKGRRNRLMDPLHSSQESPCTMGNPAGLPNADDFSQKVAFLIILLLEITKPILINGSVVVAATEPVVDVINGIDVNLTCSVANDQKTEVQNIQATWKKGANIVTVWDKDARRAKVQRRRVTRQVMEGTGQPEIETDLDRKGHENLVVGLIRDFGMVQNVSRITACLPLPKAAGEPIPWGIVPVGQLPNATVNVTWNCKVETKEKGEWVTVCAILSSSRVSKEQCEQMPGYYAWDHPQIPRRCLVIPEKTTYPCQVSRVWKNRYEKEEVCQNDTKITTMEEWKSIWGPSLLETYSYLGKVNWCIEWKGKREQDYGKKSSQKDKFHQKGRAVGLWNCSQVLTCDTKNQIGIEPVKILLQWGCECRGYNHSLKGKIRGRWDCKTTTVRSPGNLVWVTGHGHWTTHMPVDGPVTQITLGVPTLCPFWKESNLAWEEIRGRMKREIGDDIPIGDEWHEPDAGVAIGWVLESLFTPVAAFRNREMLYKLLGQTERLAAATKKGFKDINSQLQATSRMTLQNRMALDMLLLKEHGVCQYLKTKIDHCCIHIPNMTLEVEKDISQLETIEFKTRDIEKEAQHNWIGEIFESLGLSVSGWVLSVIQNVLLFAVLLLIIWLVYKCVLGVIERETRRTRRVMKALTRDNEKYPPPPKYEIAVGRENPAFERPNDN